MKAIMDSNAIEEAAARWVAKRHSGVWTQVDQAQLDAWLEAATVHQIQYIRIESTWNHAARLQALGAGIPRGVIPPPRAWGDASFFKGTSQELRPPTDKVGDTAIEEYRREGRLK